MAITALNDYAIGDIDLTAIVETLDKTYKGKAEITISEYDTDSAPDVKVGSVFENNGALFIVDTSDITPTGYSGISNSTTFYLYYDESAGAFIYSSTVPVWSDALQGWYNGNDRAFFSMYKDSGGTLYKYKLKVMGYDFIATFTSGDIQISYNNSAGVGAADLLDSTTYTEIGRIYCLGSGTVKTTMSIGTTGGGRTATGRIYKNGVPVGTERTTASSPSESFTEDINVSFGDELELYAKISATGYYLVGGLRISTGTNRLPYLISMFSWMAWDYNEF